MTDIAISTADQDVPAHFRRGAAQDAHQRRRHRAVLSALDGLPPGRVLDYACGWGDITWAMSRSHPDIHALDVDERRVEFAQREYAPLPFSVCGAGNVDFPDASFDIVVSVVVLPFVPDDAAYLAETRRVLRPGGHLILATKICPLVRRLWHRAMGTPERSRLSSTGIRNHTPHDVERLLHDNGFEILQRSGFYDPPFEAHKNLADLLNGSIELFGETFGMVAPAPYMLFVARRSGSG